MTNWLQRVWSKGTSTQHLGMRVAIALLVSSGINVAMLLCLRGEYVIHPYSLNCAFGLGAWVAPLIGLGLVVLHCWNWPIKLLAALGMLPLLAVVCMTLLWNSDGFASDIDPHQESMTEQALGNNEFIRTYCINPAGFSSYRRVVRREVDVFPHVRYVETLSCERFDE